MEIFRSIVRFFTGKTEENDDDDDDKEERECSPYRNHVYRTPTRMPAQNVQLHRTRTRTPYCCNTPSNLDSLLWPPQLSHHQTLPLQNQNPFLTFNPPLSQNLPISSLGNNNSIRKPPLETAPAPVKTSPLDDHPPPMSYKNAVIKSLQAESGQPDRMTVPVPKFTASLAYTTADKAIQASSILPRKVSVKSTPKKGGEEVKKEVVVIKKTMVVNQGRWIKHYSSRHRILLVGDGDFSFSACLATAFRCANNMIATSLDSKEFLMKNYNQAESNLKELKKRQCKVLHGIDATKMVAHELLGRLHFDRIIFNFPFAGFFNTLSRNTQLKRHRKLVSEFLKNAKEMVSENGEIHISHKTNGFHGKWNLESMASSHELRLIEAVVFSLDDYPGYNTKYGFGGDNNFECNPSKTYKFGIKTL